MFGEVKLCNERLVGEVELYNHVFMLVSPELASQSAFHSCASIY